MRFLADQGCTSLLTSEQSPTHPDDDLQFLIDGTIHLDYQPSGRSLTVRKIRYGDFQPGVHAMTLSAQGLQVYPRLTPPPQITDVTFEVLSSGHEELDRLCGGGLERGTISLICGPSGVGKTTLGLEFLLTAAAQGRRSVFYSFEEEVPVILHRCDSRSLAARALIERGTLVVRKIEPLLYHVDEFASLVRHDVEEHTATLVMLDSVAGLQLCLQGEDLISRLQAIGKYLQNSGVAVLIAQEGPGLAGDFLVTHSGLSYLADNLIFMRYFEFAGEIRRAVGVLKKRLGNFEKALRAFEITSEGIKVGPPLDELAGILTGIPERRRSPDG